MGVSKNRGTPKWMIYHGKSQFKWMLWGENPPFSETPISANHGSVMEILHCPKKKTSPKAGRWLEVNPNVVPNPSCGGEVVLPP